MPFELVDLLARHAGLETPAILAPGRPPLSHLQLRREILRCHRSLRDAGIDAGARVALVLPNGPEAAVATLAIASHAACMPLNPAYREAELRACLAAMQADTVVHAAGDAGPAATLAVEMGLRAITLTIDPASPAGSLALGIAPAGVTSVEPAARPAAQDGRGQPALLLHTSGTTGRPKIVPLTQANLAAASLSIAAHLRLGPDDRALNMMPLFHVHGLVGSVLATLASGGSVVCTPGFDADGFPAWLERWRPSWYTAAPAIHQAVLALGEAGRLPPAQRLRFVRSASSAMPPRLIAAIESVLGVPVIEAYGTTEASSPIASNPLPPAVRKIGSVGLPAGAQVAIADKHGSFLAPGAVGEIVIRGAGVMAGYEADAAANAAAFVDGWFRTGDIGRFDEDGYLYVQGRIKEIINRGGEKIAPREVDEALQALPGVLEAAAFPVPHPTLGEDLAALVVLREGAPADAAALRQALRARVADFKVPSSLHFVAAIPRNASGKVHRAGLNDWLATVAAPADGPEATATERWLLAVCCEVLRIDRLGRGDDFFRAGGDSLRAAAVAGRINAHFGLDLAATALFELPTLVDLAARIDRDRHEAAQAEARLLSEIEALSDDEVERLLLEEGR